MSVVTEYIEKLIPTERAYFEHMHNIVHTVAPDVEDTFSYGLPAYKHKGKYLIAFASNKKFLSIYPTPGPIEVLKEELAPFTLSKGTISFTMENPIPLGLLQMIVQLNKESIDKNIA